MITVKTAERTQTRLGEATHQEPRLVYWPWSDAPEATQVPWPVQRPKLRDVCSPPRAEGRQRDQKEPTWSAQKAQVSLRAEQQSRRVVPAGLRRSRHEPHSLRGERGADRGLRVVVAPSLGTRQGASKPRLYLATLELPWNQTTKRWTAKVDKFSPRKRDSTAVGESRPPTVTTCQGIRRRVSARASPVANNIVVVLRSPSDRSVAGSLRDGLKSKPKTFRTEPVGADSVHQETWFLTTFRYDTTTRKGNCA